VSTENITDDELGAAKLDALFQVLTDEGWSFCHPPDWPKCVTCGNPALDGHRTCGLVECHDGGLP
jgi:hypothetical protein